MVRLGLGFRVRYWEVRVTRCFPCACHCSVCHCSLTDDELVQLVRAHTLRLHCDRADPEGSRVTAGPLWPHRSGGHAPQRSLLPLASRTPQCNVPQSDGQRARRGRACGSGASDPSRRARHVACCSSSAIRGPVVARAPGLAARDLPLVDAVGDSACTALDPPARALWTRPRSTTRACCVALSLRPRPSRLNLLLLYYAWRLGPPRFQPKGGRHKFCTLALRVST